MRKLYDWAIFSTFTAIVTYLGIAAIWSFGHLDLVWFNVTHWSEGARLVVGMWCVLLSVGWACVIRDEW